SQARLGTTGTTAWGDAGRQARPSRRRRLRAPAHADVRARGRAPTRSSLAAVVARTPARAVAAVARPVRAAPRPGARRSGCVRPDSAAAGRHSEGLSPVATLF